LSEMSAADAIVDSLVANGVDTVFGLPGAQMYALFDAIQRRGNKIRMVGARHEQGIAYMAFGYARSSGRLGVFSPVPGPGVLNATAALCTAYGTCSPMLCLTGEVPSQFKGQGRGHLHELPDQLGILERLTRYAAHIEAPAEVPRRMREAIGAALSGRQGPAALSICWDTLGKKGEVSPPAAPEISVPASADADQVAACVRLIIAAKQPMIFTGSGAQHASAEIAALAERLCAPVVGFRGGRGVVGEDQPLGLSMAAARKIWPQTDLMIGIGTRLEIPFIRWAPPLTLVRSLPGRPLIRIDIDPAEMSRLITAGPLVADSAVGARALLDALDAAGYRSPVNHTAIAEAKARAAVEVREIQPQVDYLEVIREVLPPDGFFVEELSQMGFASNFAYPVLRPRTYVSCGYQGTLGFGFPTALGVKVAHPNRPVVSVTGDGGFMFGMPELATAVQYGINIVVLVFDNGGYGNVRRDQVERFGGRLIGADLVNPDFVKLAESFSVDAVAVDSPAALRPALERALGLDAPALIHVRVPRGSEVSPWKFIHPA
jgi:acetolactate synthase I/II/III large subunit